MSAPAKIEPLGLQLANVQQPGANLPQSLRNPNLSNAELVQIAGEEATMNIPGKGAVPGTFKHSYATNLIKEYQGAYGNRGLTPNYRFFISETRSTTVIAPPLRPLIDNQTIIRIDIPK